MRVCPRRSPAVSRESCNLFVHPEGRNYVYETDNEASDQLTFHG